MVWRSKLSISEQFTAMSFEATNQDEEEEDKTWRLFAQILNQTAIYKSMQEMIHLDNGTSRLQILII